MKRISISQPFIGEAEKSAVMAVLDSGHLAQGPRTAQFEQAFAAMLHVKHAVAVTNGTCALQVALLAHGIGPGDEVITSPFTFMATVNAILFAGAKPVFADILPDTYNIDPACIEAAITPRTKAIMPVHLYGQLCDMDAIMAIAAKYGLVVIEDACQAVLAHTGGTYAGGFGTGAFSFYATKNMMTGEGGMVTTNDDGVADRCRMIRNHGMKQRYCHDMVGYNMRMNDIQAAIGLVQIERLPLFTQKRRENAAYLSAHITSVATPTCADESAHVWHQYTVRLAGSSEREAAIRKLNEAGIDCGIYYPIPVHQQNSIAHLTSDCHCPVAEQAAQQVLSLPVHPQLATEDLDRIVMEVNTL